jgi:hypothetical protein
MKNIIENRKKLMAAGCSQRMAKCILSFNKDYVLRDIISDRTDVLIKFEVGYCIKHLRLGKFQGKVKLYKPKAGWALDAKMQGLPYH